MKGEGGGSYFGEAIFGGGVTLFCLLLRVEVLFLLLAVSDIRERRSAVRVV